MLEEFYQKIAPFADDVAERVRMMGGRAIGTMAEFKEHARISEQPVAPRPRRGEWSRTCSPITSRSFRDLRKDVDVCSDELNDQGTADFLIGLMEQHEKMAWMHRAFLEGTSVG